MSLSPHHHRRTTALAIFVGLGVVAVTTACATPGGLRAGGAGPVVVTTPLGSTVPPDSGPTGATSPPANPAPATTTPAKNPPAKPVSGGCTASALSYVGDQTDGAMGSIIDTYTVRNRGSAACRLQGVPHLDYLSGGRNVAVPGDYSATGGAVVLVQPGSDAQFSARHIDGYGGYAPGSPQCAHPATYAHLSAVLADGSVLPLGGNAAIAVQCGQIDVATWQSPA